MEGLLGLFPLWGITVYCCLKSSVLKSVISCSSFNQFKVISENGSLFTWAKKLHKIMQIKRFESLCPNFKNTDKITQVINSPHAQKATKYPKDATLQKQGMPFCYNGSVQSISQVWTFVTPWIAAHRDFLYFVSWNLLQFMSFEAVMPSNHLILCHPFLFLPSIFPSIRGFSNELAFHIRWPKYCRFNFSISPSSEYSWLMSFTIDWLDLLAVQGTLKSLL